VINYNLGEIVITANNNAITNTASIIEITEQDITEKRIFNTDEIFRYFPGIYIRKNSRNESVLNIRGYDQREIAIFLDGAPISMPFEGQVDLSQLPIEPLEQITINKSMPSVFYGANNMAGAINLVSKEMMNGAKASATLNYGTNSNNVQSSYSGAFDNAFWNLSINYLESPGFHLPDDTPDFRNTDSGLRNNSDYKQFNYFIKGGYNFNNFNKASISFYSVNNNKSIPINAYSNFPRFWKYSEWNKSILNAAYIGNYSENIGIRTNIFYEKFYNVLDSYDDETFSSLTKKYAFQSIYNDFTTGANVMANINIFDNAPFKLGFILKNDVHMEIDNKDMPEETFEAITTSLNFEQIFNIINNINFVVGVSNDWMKPTIADNTKLRKLSSVLNGYLGVAYKATDGLRLHSNVSSKNRFPTLKEMYAEIFGKYINNPELNNEKSINFEMGFSHSMSDLSSLTGNIFFSDIKNLIQLVSLPQNNRQFQNVDASIKGLEFIFKTKVLDIDMNMNYTYLEAVNVSDNADSKLLEYKPRHNLSTILSSGYEFGFRWMTGFNFIGYHSGINGNTSEMIRMPDYLIIEALMAQKIFDSFELYLKAENITDKYYETEWGFPMPGRSFLIGINYLWE